MAINMDRKEGVIIFYLNSIYVKKKIENNHCNKISSGNVGCLSGFLEILLKYLISV